MDKAGDPSDDMVVPPNWEEELYSWNLPGLERLGDWPQPKLADLLRFVKMARNTPDVWDLFVEFDRKRKAGVISQEALAEGNSDEQADAWERLGRLTSWYRGKFRLRETSFVPYSCVGTILQDMAAAGGIFTEQDIVGLFMVRYPTLIGGLSNEAGQQ